MNENIVVGEVGAEELELVDFGDAAVETRVFHPAQLILDNSFQWGRSFLE